MLLYFMAAIMICLFLVVLVIFIRQSLYSYYVSTFTIMGHSSLDIKKYFGELNE